MSSDGPHKPIFRKAALAKLSSPEQLDKLLHVVGPKGWMAMVYLFLIVLAIVLWAIFGSIPNIANGGGVYMDLSLIKPVTVPFDAEIIEMKVMPGEVVAEGQPLMVLTDVEYGKQLMTARKKVDFLKEELSVLEKILEHNEEGKEVQFSPEEIDQAKKALPHALVDPLIFRSILKEVDEQLVSGKREELVQASITVATLEAHPSTLVMKAPYAGTVLEIYGNQGDRIPEGDFLTYIQVSSTSKITGTERVYCFVPVSMTNIKEGMTAYVRVWGVDTEVYGHIVGEVERFSLTPAVGDFFDTLHIDEELKSVLTDGYPSFPVVIKLHKADTISGYEWSSDYGPPFAIKLGSIASVEIAVEEREPLSYVMPIWYIKRLQTYYH